MCTIRWMREARHIRILRLLVAAVCGGCARNEPLPPSRSDNAEADHAPVGRHRYFNNERVEFHIPAEGVSEALRAWTLATHKRYGLRIPDPEPVTLPIDGLYTPAEALCWQLKGTGLTYFIEDDGNGDQGYAIGLEGAVIDSKGKRLVPSLSAICAQKNPGSMTEMD